MALDSKVHCNCSDNTNEKDIMCRGCRRFTRVAFKTETHHTTSVQFTTQEVPHFYDAPFDSALCVVSTKVGSDIYDFMENRVYSCQPLTGVEGFLAGGAFAVTYEKETFVVRRVRDWKFVKSISFNAGERTCVTAESRNVFVLHNPWDIRVYTTAFSCLNINFGTAGIQQVLLPANSNLLIVITKRNISAFNLQKDTWQHFPLDKKLEVARPILGWLDICHRIDHKPVRRLLIRKDQIDVSPPCTDLLDYTNFATFTDGGFVVQRARTDDFCILNSQGRPQHLFHHESVLALKNILDCFILTVTEIEARLWSREGRELCHLILAREFDEESLCVFFDGLLLLYHPDSPEAQCFRFFPSGFDEDKTLGLFEICAGEP